MHNQQMSIFNFASFASPKDLKNKHKQFAQLKDIKLASKLLRQPGIQSYYTKST